MNTAGVHCDVSCTTIVLLPYIQLLHQGSEECVLCTVMLSVGIPVMDQTMNMLGMTSMFVGGFTALILDNMIAGMT